MKFKILLFQILSQVLLVFDIWGQGVQSDTTLLLQHITITESRNKAWSAGTGSAPVENNLMEDSPSHHLGQTMADQGLSFIRSYGLSTLATMSLRGGSANHTAVTWHGFNINSPMNGLTDLALIPTAISRNSVLHLGGLSSLWGGSAIGGQLAMGSKPGFNRPLQAALSATAGSFGRYSQVLDIQYGNSKWSSKLSVFNLDAKNDFTYEPGPNKSKTKMPNGQIKMSGLVSENYLMLAERHRVGLHLWWQDADRNIPPTLLDDYSDANQKDINTRLAGDYTYAGEILTWIVRGSFFREDQNYKYPKWSIDDQNAYDQSAVEAEVRWSGAAGHKAVLGSNVTRADVSSTNYESDKKQRNTAVFGAYIYQSGSGDLKLSLNLRQEWIDSKSVPFVYSAGAEYQAGSRWTFRAQAGRVFRNPTLNERFWRFGGNPSLAPEDGYTADIGVDYRSGHDAKTSLRHSSGLFGKSLSNWINWAPDSTGNWQPRNLTKVQSYGLETRTSITHQMGKVKAGAELNATIQSSKTTESIVAGDPSLHKQLIYVPIVTSMAGIFAESAGVSVSLRHNYVSKRYTSSDNSTHLPSYGLLSGRVGYKFSAGRAGIQTFVACHNLANKTYAVIEYWPMPGRNFEAGIVIKNL